VQLDLRIKTSAAPVSESQVAQNRDKKYALLNVSYRKSFVYSPLFVFRIFRSEFGIQTDAGAHPAHYMISKFTVHEGPGWGWVVNTTPRRFTPGKDPVNIV
jgi:hypothetical protein